MADDLTLKQALDHAEAFHARMVKPFEKLPGVLRAAVNAEVARQAADAAVVQAQRELATLRTTVDAETKAWNEKTLALATSYEERQRGLEQSAREAHREAHVAHERLVGELAEQRAPLVAQVATLTEQRDALGVEVVALRDQRNALQREVQAILTRLGG